MSSGFLAMIAVAFEQTLLLQILFSALACACAWTGLYFWNHTLECDRPRFLSLKTRSAVFFWPVALSLALILTIVDR